MNVIFDEEVAVGYWGWCQVLGLQCKAKMQKVDRGREANFRSPEEIQLLWILDEEEAAAYC